MSNITSAGVSRRFEGHFAISGQALTRAQPVAERLVQRLARALQEGETMPDIAFVQTLVARTIGILNAELEDSDNQRKHFRSVDRYRRDVMTKAGNKLRFALADVRYILDRTLSKETARAVFEGRSNLTRLVSPVLERVSGRLVTLLADPKFDWEALPDAGYRTTLDASRQRLVAALAEFDLAKSQFLPERDALEGAKSSFDHDYDEKGEWLRGLVRILRGFYEGLGFEREAAVLALRRRKPAQKDEEPGPSEPGKKMAEAMFGELFEEGAAAPAETLAAAG